MLAKAETDSVATTVDRWLAQFERALAERDDVLLATLFHADSHWRDVLALTWDIRTVSGLDAIVKELRAHVGRARPAGFRTAPQRTAPRRVTRAGTSAIEAIFQFETADGRGSGVLRLTPDANHGTALKAWTLLTSLDELTGTAEQAGRSRSADKSYSRDFRGPNWLDLRTAAAEYVDRDPAVLVVGGGQAGLSIAARLTQLQIDTLVVDREARIGDNWRNRYHALVLHNQTHANHLPYMHVSADLAELHSQGQACRLVRGLRGKHGAQLLDRHRIRGRQVRRTGRSDGPLRCGVRTARSGRCTRGTSSWPPE